MISFFFESDLSLACMSVSNSLSGFVSAFVSVSM